MNNLFFKEVLDSLSKESKCIAKKVGCLIVKDQRIISMGYNGTLSGLPNCNEEFNSKKFERHEHHDWSLKNEIHAEQNAIAMAAKNGIALAGATCYCSLQPCNSCLMSLIQSGIVKIIYLEAYNKGDYNQNLIQYLDSKNIIFEKFVA